MPRGSVRSILTLGIVTATMAAVLTGHVVPEWVQGLALAATGGYFVDRHLNA